MKKAELITLLENLPSSPGVYLMKNHNGVVIYVGKAKNLKKRVRQYFTPSTSDTRFFIKNLAGKISAIDTVITTTEKEALLLEYNLIHRHMPRYNIRLTDDKRFLHIRLNPNEEWPKLQLVRKPKKDGAMYFGPYHFAKNARETLKLVNRHFKLRNCKDTAFKNRVRPCLQYQIKRCPAPCTLNIDKEYYKNQVQFVTLFLEGKRDTLIKQLQQKMTDEAENLNFEAAAVLRDQIDAVKGALAPQLVTEFTDKDRDIVGFHQEGSSIAAVVMNIVSGNLIGMKDFYFKEWEFSNEDFISSFITQHYTPLLKFPDEIILPVKIEDSSAISEYLSEKKGKKIRIYHPQRGSRVKQIEMALENAKEIFKKQTLKAEDIEQKLTYIQKHLHLVKLPVNIECVDIAHFGGTNTVGAISKVESGRVSREKGRPYIIKTAKGGDDFLAMYEVLKRRFTRAGTDDKKWTAPDLLVVDGGKGQLAIALKVLEELNISDQAVVALAKEKSDSSSTPSDRIFLKGRMNPVILKERTPLSILALARDEAHRLANGFQSKRRTKNISKSELDQIEGIGPKTKQLLLKNMGSVKNIKSSTVEELSQIEGIGKKTAQSILDKLNKKP
ncbi:MAG: excinuclease ABC subunit UvrC [Deltaproteobacteria bacterium]|nr:excinuclease ABC subunit UvrC [Deltaproteobacteria bacterium]